jgi:hypothetical protein
MANRYAASTSSKEFVDHLSYESHATDTKYYNLTCFGRVVRGWVYAESCLDLSRMMS